MAVHGQGGHDQGGWGSLWALSDRSSCSLKPASGWACSAVDSPGPVQRGPADEQPKKVAPFLPVLGLGVSICPALTLLLCPYAQAGGSSSGTLSLHCVSVWGFQVSCAVAAYI